MKASVPLVAVFALGAVIGGDGGVIQRPVYAGECLARGSDGKLFVARAGEPCVALQPPPPPPLGDPAVPGHIAEASAEPRAPEASEVLRRMPEPGGLCGTP